MNRNIIFFFFFFIFFARWAKLASTSSGAILLDKRKSIDAAIRMQMNDWLLHNERNEIEAEFDVLECNKNNAFASSTKLNRSIVIILLFAFITERNY